MADRDEAIAFVSAFNDGDLDALAAMLGPGYRYTDRYAGIAVDAATHLDIMRAVLTNVPDRAIAVDRVLASGSTRVVEGQWSGTPGGGDVAVRTHIVLILDLADGRIVEGRAYYREPELTPA